MSQPAVELVEYAEQSAEIGLLEAAECGWPEVQPRGVYYGWRADVSIVFNSDQNYLRNYVRNSEFLWDLSENLKFETVETLSKRFGEIPRKFHQNRCKIRWTQTKILIFFYRKSKK